MTITYTGDPATLQSSANNTAGCLGELENHLRALSNIQDEMQAAVQSHHTGGAIYKRFGDAFVSGKSLAATLQDIVSALSQSGVTADASDLEGAGKLLGGAGLNGAFDGGGWVNTNF